MLRTLLWALQPVSSISTLLRFILQKPVPCSINPRPRAQFAVLEATLVRKIELGERGEAVAELGRQGLTLGSTSNGT